MDGHLDRRGADAAADVMGDMPITTCPRAGLTEMTIGEVTLPAGTRIVLPLQLLNLDQGIDISIADNRVRTLAALLGMA